MQPNGDFILTHIPANYDQVGIPLLNMGLYYGHAFLITDLKQVAGTYTCGDCQARFTGLTTWHDMWQTIAVVVKPKSTVPTTK